MSESESEHDELYATDCDSQELEERAIEAQPKNTRKTTSWAVAVYRRWAARRSRHHYIKADILDYGTDASALNKTLHKFYGEVHTVEGRSLTPSSLQVLRAGLQRHLADHHEQPLDLSGSELKANAAFKAAKRRYALSGNNPQAGKQKQPIDPADQEKIRQYFSMSNTFEDPRKLQEFVYYMLSMHFGYRGSEIWHQIKHQSFKEGVDEQGRPRLMLDQAICEKNYQHTGPNSTCRQVITITDDEEAEVYMYTTLKLYISKLDPKQQAFLAKPKNAAQMAKNPDGPWHVNAPVGIKTIAKIMPDISRKAGTSQRYTNHCVRHTLGTNMMRMGFSLSAIQSRLRLRSAATISWYTGHRTAQELDEETRHINAPLRGVQCPGQAGDAGLATGHSQEPSTSRGTCRSARPRQLALTVARPDRHQTPPAPAPMAEEGAGDHPDGDLQHGAPPARAVLRPLPAPWVVPLHLADLTWPPPPVPGAAVGPAHLAVPAKVFSGTFHNCTFY